MPGTLCTLAARAAPPPLATRLLYREAQVCANRGPRVGPCNSTHFVPTRSSRRLPLPQLSRSASRWGSGFRKAPRAAVTGRFQASKRGILGTQLCVICACPHWSSGVSLAARVPRMGREGSQPPQRASGKLHRFCRVSKERAGAPETHGSVSHPQVPRGEGIQVTVPGEGIEKVPGEVPGEVPGKGTRRSTRRRYQGPKKGSAVPEVECANGEAGLDQAGGAVSPQPVTAHATSPPVTAAGLQASLVGLVLTLGPPRAKLKGPAPRRDASGSDGRMDSTPPQSAPNADPDSPA
ncbi:uncharacterized protein LOC144241868 isoform X2 [Crocuta crocuta]